MPRVGRAARGGVVYHALNRGSGRMRLFQKEGDYEAFIDAIWAVPRGLKNFRESRNKFARPPF